MGALWNFSPEQKDLRFSFQPYRKYPFYVSLKAIPPFALLLLMWFSTWSILVGNSNIQFLLIQANNFCFTMKVWLIQGNECIYAWNLRWRKLCLWFLHYCDSFILFLFIVHEAKKMNRWLHVLLPIYATRILQRRRLICVILNLTLHFCVKSMSCQTWYVPIVSILYRGILVLFPSLQTCFFFHKKKFRVSYF